MPAILAAIGGALASFAAWVGRILIVEVMGRLITWAKNEIAKAKKMKQIDEQAKASVEPLKKAKTAEEIDEAAKKALDDF